MLPFSDFTDSPMEDASSVHLHTADTAVAPARVGEVDALPLSPRGGLARLPLSPLGNQSVSAARGAPQKRTGPEVTAPPSIRRRLRPPAPPAPSDAIGQSSSLPALMLSQTEHLSHGFTPPVLPAAPPAVPPAAPPAASPLAMPFPLPAAGVHLGTDFVSGLEHFPQLATGLNFVEVTPLCVAWDVQVGADGSRIETDQRAEFVRARLGMGVMTPQVGRAGERGGVHRIDMQPTDATTPNPNVVKMQRYAASHPSSAEAKVQAGAAMGRRTAPPALT